MDLCGADRDIEMAGAMPVGTPRKLSLFLDVPQTRWPGLKCPGDRESSETPRQAPAPRPRRVTAIRSLRRAREVAPTARAWQREVQCLGDERGLSIEVHRSPPGTSKRNKIEPRLVHQPVSFIRQNWPAKSLIGHGARVDPTAATQPAAGRKGTAKAPKTNIPKAPLIPDAGRAGIDLQRADLTWRME